MKNKQLRRWLLILGPLVAAAVILWPTVDAYLLEQEETQALQQAMHGKDSTALKAFENAKGERFRTAKDRKSTRLNSSHVSESRMPSSA